MCIEFTKAEGIFFDEKDFILAKEYVENMLDEEEIERIVRREKFTIKNATQREAIESAKNVVKKLEKQKELIK